jgi:sulfide:quinone oxidoreductase
MATRVLVLGAGFGGLELASILSAELGDDVDVALIDKEDAFVFGFAKLAVMFGQKTTEAVRLDYRDIAKPGVRVLKETLSGETGLRCEPARPLVRRLRRACATE